MINFLHFLLYASLNVTSSCNSLKNRSKNVHTIYRTVQNFDGENVDKFLAISDHQNFTIQGFLAIAVNADTIHQIFHHMV